MINTYDVSINTEKAGFIFSVKAETILDACSQAMVTFTKKYPENTDQVVSIEAHWME